MSKLIEYLKLIPRGIANIDKVVEGLKNQVKIELGIIPEDDLEVIVGRRLICSQCPYMSANAKKMGVYETDRIDEHCTMCGCPLVTRTASLESDCGIEAYNTNHPNNTIPLKWKKVK